MKKRILALLLALLIGVSLNGLAENAVLANAALVVDGRTGEILYQQNAFEMHVAVWINSFFLFIAK